MDRLISATEANQRFSEMLRDVGAGESVTITSRGRPVARLVPVEQASQADKVRQLLAYVDTLPRIVGKPWTREDLYN